MLFALSNGLLDASIVAWDAKRHVDTVRPVTAVHFLTAGNMIRAWGGPYQGTVVMRGELWEPYQPASVVTPPFPEFISGHSIFSATSAEIRTRYTGSDVLNSSVTIPPVAVEWSQDSCRRWISRSQGQHSAMRLTRLGFHAAAVGSILCRAMSRPGPSAAHSARRCGPRRKAISTERCADPPRLSREAGHRCTKENARAGSSLPWHFRRCRKAGDCGARKRQ